MRSLAYVAAALACASVVADDSITALPGYSGSDTMFGGYLNVDATANRNLYYFFVQSRRSPATDPLVLWLNGGPGCSSVGGGLFSELGPFFPSPSDDGQTLVNNPYSWAEVTNLLFIESPAGVGFSFSDDPADYIVGDARTSRDIFVALQQFIARYPQYAGRPLYVTGESYGGHYVPNAAAYLVKQTLAGNNTVAQLNIQGFAVGNAWTVAELDNIGAVKYWYERSMIDNATFNGVLNTCNMSGVGPLFKDSKVLGEDEAGQARGALGFTSQLDAAGQPVLHLGDACDDYQNTASAMLGNINIYASYVDVCNEPSSGSAKALQAAKVSAKGLTEGSNGASGCAYTYDPCVEDKTTLYLNRPDVKTAIHANTSITWSECSSIITYSRSDLLTSMLPVYDYLLTNWPQGQWMVYSGDVDAIVPTPGTKLWLAELGLPVSANGAWRSWNVGGQVGGWTTAYDGPAGSRLTFVTVRNAGHMVPQTQQERALYMIRQYLQNKTL